MTTGDPPEKRDTYRPPVAGQRSMRENPPPLDNTPPERRIWTPPLTIGVLADTHMPTRARELPVSVIRGMHDVDLILHAGDITTRDALEHIRKVGPAVLAVRGNQDAPDLAFALPIQRVVTVGEWRIGITHGDGSWGTTAERARRAFTKVDCVIFGHSHQPMNEVVDGVLMFNPGSSTDRRREPAFSFGYLHVTDDGITGELVRFQRD